MKNSNNLLIIDGGLVKTEAEGVVKGMGIVFGSETEPDQSSMRDFFTEDSYITKRNSFELPLYYEHAMGVIDEEIGTATLTKTSGGWEAVAQIDTSTPEGKKIYERVKTNPHGFSSGAMQHLVKRESRANNTNFLKKWGAGELSLTERPAERRAIVESIKSLDGEFIKEDIWADPEEGITIAIFDQETGKEVWNIESGLEIPDQYKTLPIKMVYGSVTYDVSIYDENSNSGAEITVYEWGGVESLITHLQNVINTAAVGVKSMKTPDEEDFESRVLEIVKSKFEKELVKDTNNNDVNLSNEMKQLKEELADLKTQLSDRDEALTNAKERVAQLEILAGAKDTINKNKGNKDEK